MSPAFSPARLFGGLIERLHDTGYSPRLARGIGLLVFFGLLLAAEVLLIFQERENESERRLATLGYASTLRARLDRELNAVLYLTSGLSSYLAVRNNRLDPREVNDILAVLHRNSRHVRNFGIAVGYRLSYVYPLQGNQSAIGLDYTQLPSQWPQVKRAIDSVKGTLAGPVQLIQGGTGLVYRSPVFVDGKYWGLLSTVIDSDSFFGGAFDEVLSDHYDFAIRGQDGAGSEGAVIRGDPKLFEDAASVLLDAEVPNGHWVFAVRDRHGPKEAALIWIIRGLSWLLAGLIGTATAAVLGHRIELARLAMADGLTGLPNRRLLGDRLTHALQRHARREGNHCAILFIDLDEFKAINDRHGHPIGDLVLRTAAQRIHDEVRLGDTVARWGGDEFVVVVEETDRGNIDGLVNRLRQRIAEPVAGPGLSLSVGASIGVALHPEDGGDTEQLLNIADQRMYADKARRKS